MGQYIVLTHDLDKPDHWWADGPFEWTCTVGPTDRGKLTVAADSPMREAIRRAFLEITGHEPEFLFSGWGQPPSESEQEYIDSHKRHAVESRDVRNFQEVNG